MNNFMKIPIENKSYLLALIGGISVILIGACILIAVLLMGDNQAQMYHLLTLVAKHQQLVLV